MHQKVVHFPSLAEHISLENGLLNDELVKKTEIMGLKPNNGIILFSPINRTAINEQPPSIAVHFSELKNDGLWKWL